MNITGVDIKFWDLVEFFVKAAVASIPATIILAILWFVGTLVLSACMIALGG